MRSRFEKQISAFLKSCKIKFWYEPLKIPYVMERNYMPDFVYYKGGIKDFKKPETIEDLKNTIIIEAKGYLKFVDMQKMIAVKNSNPELDIRFLFQSDGFVYPNKKGAPRRTPESKDMRYSEWAEKYEFPWAIGTEVPEEWLT